LEIDESVVHSGGKSVKVVGIIATGFATHTRFSHDLVPVEGGKTFTVAFWAKVDANEAQSRPVDFSTQMESHLWPGLYSETIILDSTDWKEYTHTFLVTAGESELMWFGLFVAESDVDFWVDDVRFFEGTPADEVSFNETSVSPVDKLRIVWGRIKKRY
jgi:hypothetical protein